MAKYLQNKPARVQKQKRKKSGWGFVIGMLIYAVVFLGLVAFGLTKFWAYMEAYEASRPYIAIDAYMEQLTEDHICDSSAELIAQIDHNIQSEEACRQVIKDALSEGITYARKAAECTENRQVFALRSGKQVIGSFTITASQPDEYGFTPWQFAEDSFDMSFLLGQSVSATAPEGYPVYVNGVQLGSSYVTDQQTIPYAVFEEYYDDFDLPSFTKVTYKAGPFLGDFPMEVKDLQGNPYVFDENVDINSFVDNCNEAEIQKLDTFINAFIDRYVVFTGSANKTRFDNYDRLVVYMVPDSMLATRMRDAIEGLHFAQSQGDKIVSITANHLVNIGDGRYLCDVTYLVDTTGREGVVQTTNNVKIIVVETTDGLKAESMTSY
jgi:hypothetical protein